MNTPLQQEILAYITQDIRFGFDTPERIYENILGIFEGELLDKKWLKETIWQEYETYQWLAQHWQKPTDFDKLTQVFEQLNSEGVIALHNPAYTHTDCLAQVQIILNTLEKEPSFSTPIGYCFYHTQALVDAIHPKKQFLELRFGNFYDNKAITKLIGHRIQSLLQQQGLPVQWNNESQNSLRIEPIDWKKLPDLEVCHQVQSIILKLTTKNE